LTQFRGTIPRRNARCTPGTGNLRYDNRLSASLSAQTTRSSGAEISVPGTGPRTPFGRRVYRCAPPSKPASTPSCPDGFQRICLGRARSSSLCLAGLRCVCLPAPCAVGDFGACVASSPSPVKSRSASEPALRRLPPSVGLRRGVHFAVQPDEVRRCAKSAARSIFAPNACRSALRAASRLCKCRGW